MTGAVSFHFDDGHNSHYRVLLPLFKKYGFVGSLSIIADEKRGMGFEKARMMQDEGWEILCHSKTHIKMDAPSAIDLAETEIAEAKRILEENGLHTRQYVTPMSEAHESLLPILKEHFDAAFTVYTNALTVPLPDLLEEMPLSPYRLHRACMKELPLERLIEMTDYACDSGKWLVFYDHDIGYSTNVTEQILDGLLAHCKERGIPVLTSTEGLKRFA